LISGFSPYLCDMGSKIQDMNFSFKELMMISSLAADEVVRRLQPVKDDISQREAWELYGRAVVIAAENSGLVKVRMIGNRKLFSRVELNAFSNSREMVQSRNCL
jgi:hypothetical protein